MKLTRKTFAALAAACVMLALALTTFAALNVFHVHDIALLLLKYGSFFAFGIVTSTYNFFIAQNLQTGTTPPTLAQALNENMLNVLLNWADSDTTATLTHNWNMSAAEQTALLPLMSIFPTQTNTNTTVVAVTAQNTNTVTVGKQANAGSGGTYVVQMLHPNTLIR